MPAMNHSELPGTSVMALAIQPAVQDSAVASFSSRAASHMPTSRASFNRRSSSGIMLLLPSLARSLPPSRPQKKSPLPR
jgi:hypothetical protein